MEVKNLQADELELFYTYAKEEKWSIEDVHIRALLKTHPNDFFIFYKTNQLLGFVVALKESDTFGFISSLLVLKEFRNLGYGSKIFSYALEHLQERQIALDSIQGKENFYKKFGFNSYYNVNIYKFITGSLSIHNNTFTIKELDTKDLMQSSDTYLKHLLTNKETKYKAIQVHNKVASFAFTFPYKDGYKITINTKDINHAVSLFFTLTSSYNKNSTIYIQTTEVDPLLEALVQALEMKEVSHTIRMYNKIL